MNRPRRPSIPALFLSVLSLLGCPGAAFALTVGIDGGGGSLVAPGDTWRFFRGTVAPSTPADAWAEDGFDDGAWELGPSGFGFGDGDDATELVDMPDNYVTVYVRRELVVGSLPDGDLILDVDYDDGFVAYLNGVRVASANMPAGPIDFETTTLGNHEAGTPESFVLGRAADLLRVGANTLAVEGHNTSLGSSDFSLIPALRVSGASSVVRSGDDWIVSTESVTLTGLVTSASATTLRVGGAFAASFDPGSRTFLEPVALLEGRNVILLEALDASGSVLESAEIVILRVPVSSRVGGELSSDASWTGAVIVESDVTVLAGVTLTVDPGTIVLLSSGTSILVDGALQAVGTVDAPIRFTRFGNGTRWERIVFRRAAPSRMVHTTIEFADSAGEHQDYYEPGPRSYHEAVVVLASQLDLESCLFQHLPDDGASGEGDAIAVISDDPDLPGVATALVKNCRFIGIGQGVHTRFSYVRVESSYFTGHHGDNDDVNLWGESDPPPLILNNVFESPDHDDAINPTKCSAWIIGNIIRNTDDHGIVLRGRCFPVVMNNLVVNCANGGIAIENTCDALLVNNTVYGCGRGLRLFDLGRAGPPYRLEPGGGYATVINCIVWNCPSPVTLADSDNPDAEDRGSHITVLSSIIERGQGGIAVSGSASTVTWGAGSQGLNPLLVDAANGDFRLAAGSPAIDAGQLDQAPADDIDGVSRPCGEAVDIGAHETGECRDGPIRFRRGEVNGDLRTDISDAVAILLWLFAAGDEPVCVKAADVDDSGQVGITDATRLLLSLFQGGAPPSAPYPGCGLDPTDDSLGCARGAGC